MLDVVASLVASPQEQHGLGPCLSVFLFRCLCAAISGPMIQLA